MDKSAATLRLEYNLKTKGGRRSPIYISIHAENIEAITCPDTKVCSTLARLQVPVTKFLCYKDIHSSDLSKNSSLSCAVWSAQPSSQSLLIV